MIEILKKSIDIFINRINKDFKWDYSLQYDAVNFEILGVSFLGVYNSIIKRSNNVMDEIKENLMFLDKANHLSYLNYVEGRIKRDVVSNVDHQFLNKWIKKLNVTESEFPFLENKELNIILSKVIDEYSDFMLSNDVLTTEIQKDFYLYAYYLERIKILNLIENEKNISLNKNIIETENPYPQIFLNAKAFHLFDRLFEQFKDSKNQMADFSFIYRMMFKEGFILSHFKPQMFIDWIDAEPYKISLEKIKTMGDCSTEQKIRTYHNAKDIIQI